MTQEEFARALEPFRQDFLTETCVHYQHGEKERGKQSFERWRERFIQFLQEYAPDEAERFKRHMFHGILAVGSNEHPYDQFMRVDGKTCIAFIEQLADEARKGRILNFQENPSPPTSSGQARNTAEAIRIFDELTKRFEVLDFGKSSQEDFVSVRHLLERLRASIETTFGPDSQYLVALSQAQFRYPRAKQKNAVTYFDRDKGQTLVVLHKILDELRVNNPGVVWVGDGVPGTELHDSLAAFGRDHPEASKTAFIMMGFADTPVHREITKAIKQALASVGFSGVRADDKEYHPDLYPNILTYMYGCGFGIAVFEQGVVTPINPNVAFEVGYMLALKKRVCLLKDNTLPNLQADLIGKLYLAFDPQQATATIYTALSGWLATHLI